MEKGIEKLIKTIDSGREGFNKGLSSGLSKLDSLTYGVIRENITLVGGSSGAGKSSLTLFQSVYNPYVELVKSNYSFNVHWLIFSYEMSETSLLMRLLSMHLYDEYGLVVSHADLMSFEGKLPDEIYEKVKESLPWLNEFKKRCTIVDKPTTARKMYGICKSFAEAHGKFIQSNSWEKNGEEYESFDYIPNDPLQYLIVLWDHVKLISTQQGHTSKQEIDEMCQYAIYFRDKCRFTWYIVQQLNRAFQDMSRRTEAGGAYQDIQLSDFSDTGDTVNASNTVEAIFFPYRERLTKWKDYIIDPKRGGLGERGRTVSVLKNRDGQADKFVGIAFYGESHIWKELPKANEINDYSIYQTLDNLQT